MADHAYYGAMPPSHDSFRVADKPRLASMANWAGALVSLALVGGVCVWGYKLVMRDVSGIPVVAAQEGPMRIQPQNPGGQATDHLGLAVNRVAGDGTAAPPADTIVLAPRPIGLEAEDLPQAVELTAPRYAQEPEAKVALAVLREEIAAPEPQIDPVVPDAVQALADRIAADLTPGAAPEVAAMDDEAQIDPVAEELEAVAAAAAGPGLKVSLRPKVRPTGLRSASLAPVAPAAEDRGQSTADAVAAAVAAAVASPDVVAPAPTSAVPSSGERLVQLGAFDSPELARSEWDRLSGRFGDYMTDKTPVVQKASSGGRTFYRLRAMGFTDLSDARRFCAAFVARNADCIPVVAK